jgi:small subunit ribosomal protein S17
MRSKQGTVISNAGDKTIVVKVDREVRHPIYKKNYRVSKKFHAHNENNEAQVGDVVEIIESKPISKLKTWNLSKIISKNAKVIDQPAAVESESEKELHEVASREKEEIAKKEEIKEEVEEIKNKTEENEVLPKDSNDKEDSEAEKI